MGGSPLDLLLRLRGQTFLREFLKVKKVVFRFEFKKTGKDKSGAGGIVKLYMPGSRPGSGKLPKQSKLYIRLTNLLI